MSEPETDTEFLKSLESRVAIDGDPFDPIVIRLLSLARRGAKMQWRPIEEAPTDGTVVLVYACLNPPEKWHECVRDLPPYIGLSSYHPDAGWMVCEMRDVTHFMQAPAPPSTKGRQDMTKTGPVTVPDEAPDLYAENIKLRQRVRELEYSLAARKGLHEGAVLAMTTHVKKLEETQYKIDVRKEYNRLNLIYLLTCVRNFPNFAHHYGASMHEEIDAAITEMQNDKG